MSTTCDSPTDVISDWTLVVCAGVLSQRLSSWLLQLRTVGRSWGFRWGYCRHLFAEKQTDPNIIEWILSSNVLNGWVLHGRSLHSRSSGAWRSLSINISHGSVATLSRCGGTFSHCFTRNLPACIPLKEFWTMVTFGRGFRGRYPYPFWGKGSGVPI